MDLGLRPHELLKAKRNQIIKDKLHRWHFEISDDTKTGKREAMIVFAIPFVDDYLKSISSNPETPLFPFSDQLLWRIIKRISENQCSAYDLRASSMSYYSLFLTDQELKARYGSEEYRHYVRLNREKLANKIDQLAGRSGNGEEIDTLRKIAPHFCVHCESYTNKEEKECRVCKKVLDPNEEIKRAKMDKIAYKSTERLLEIAPEEFKAIAGSFEFNVISK